MQIKNPFVVLLCIGILGVLFLKPKNYSDQVAQERSVKVVSLAAEGSSQGTGTLIGGGLILTAAHIFDNETLEGLILKKGDTEFQKVDLVMISQFQDIAVLALRNVKFPESKLKMSTDWKYGEKITFVGNGGNGDFEIGHSQISAVSFIGHNGRVTPLFVFPCDTGKPGFSGGGIFNSKGELIGVFELGLFHIGQCAAIRVNELPKEIKQ